MKHYRMRLNGLELLNARLRAGLSQQKVAQRLGVSIPTVHRAEKSHGIQPSTGKALAEFFGLELATLVLPVKDIRRKSA